MKRFISIVALSLIMICGGILAGCDKSGGSLSLSFSSEKIEMVTTTEKNDYVITVTNAGDKNIQFDFGFESSIAKVIDNSAIDLGGGKYSISIAPISAGKTNLRITIRGTEKNIQIPVNISEELQSFTANDDIFVVRGGEALAINSSLFTFTPQDTTQNALSFELAPDQDLTDVIWENNKLTVGQLCTLKEIHFVAKSLDVQNITCNFSVRVVSPINTSTLKISSYSQSLTNNETFDPNLKLDVYPYEYGDNGEVTNNIELIANSPYLFQKQIAVEYGFIDDAGTAYCIDVVASSGVAGDVTETSPITDRFSGFSFAVQSVKITKKGEPHVLTFIIKQADFPANRTEVKINIFVTSTPKEIRVDGQTKLPIVELFHNSATSSNFRFSVYPDIKGAYNEDTYHYAISLYSSQDGRTVSAGELEISDVSKYIELKYGNMLFEDFISDDGSNILKNLKDLTSLLTITPKLQYQHYFVINVACLNEEGDKLCENNIFVKVYKGTTTFTFSEKYRDGTIYVAMPKGSNDGVQLFEGFDYDEGSTIGNLLITPKTINALACEVAQDLASPNLRLIITPKKVGESEFVLQTQNGLFLTLRVVVVREIEQTDFALKIEDNNQNSISNFSYKPKDSLIVVDTINSVTIKGKGASVFISEQIDAYNDVNSYSYFYTFSLVGEGAKNYFVIDGNKITSKDFTYKNGMDEPVHVQVNLTIYKVEGFKLIEKTYDTTIHFDFQVSAVDYVKNMNIRVKGSNSVEKTKAISVYDKNVLSYTNQNLAEAYIYLDLEKSQTKETYNSNIKLSSWRISVGDINSKTNKVGSIGYFYSTEYINGKPANGEDYIGKFICDISGINITSSFTITLVLTDDTGVRYESTVTIKIDNYIDVDSIYLTTPADSIYLDATEENREETISVYVVPANAMCQDIQVVIDSNTPNCIAYNQSGNTITFSFISGGFGTIRIFPVSKMKTNSITDEYGNYYYHISLPFISADGRTMETALKISSLSSLKRISSGNHYFLDTIIDCKGTEVFIPSFDNGSIRGTFAVVGSNTFVDDAQLGGINNFLVKNNGENSGLFGLLGKNAKLYNLTISGRLDENKWQLKQNASIGILAGTNSATLENVQVSLYQQNRAVFSNDANKNINVYFGLVAGTNHGNILVTENAKNSTFMAYMPMAQQLQFLSTVIDGTTYSITSYAGGIVGLNSLTGTIGSTYSTNVVLGMFGTNANLNMVANANYLGGVAGDNKGQITNLKVLGEIYDGDSGSYVGGLIGTYTNESGVVKGNTSRVFVRGYGSVSGLIGYISEANTANITKNLVQATDDGTRTGFKASLIIRYGGFGSNPTIYEIAPTQLFASGEDVNRAETYFTRGTASAVVSGLEKEFYYGDMVCVDSENFPSRIQAVVFTKGEEEVINPKVNDFVMAIYKQASQKESQAFISNHLKALEVMAIAGITANEINISTDKVSLASIINFGESLSINGTGLVKITISSSLNYTNACELNIYLTNYYTEIMPFVDKDYIEAVKMVNLINANSKKVYMNAYAEAYNYKNTPIRLNSNREITYECFETKGIVNINVSSNEIYLASVNSQKDSTVVKVNPIYVADNNIYYATYNTSLRAYVFMQEVNMGGSVKAVTDLNVSVLTGIENISIGKTIVNAEPSDNINFTVEYDSYNENDNLQAVIKVGEFIYTQNASGYFADSMGNNLFSLIISEPKLKSENHYVVDCSFKMVQEKDNYLNFRDKNIMLYLYSTETGLYDSMQISYSPESITSVLINNYSNEENVEMMSPNKYNLSYYEDKMTSSSLFSSSGDYNILKTYIYTKLAEFDYVEISMNTGMSGGYMALGKDGGIDINSVYTSIDGVVTLRVYKDDIFNRELIFDDSEHVLPMTIIYSLPSKINEGARVSIDFTFFKGHGENAVVCYQAETTIIAKSAKKVEFKIYDKETESLTSAENEAGISQAYSVVRGKKYALEVDIVGYSDEEVVFESSNPNIASISNEGGVYYLTVSNASIVFVNPYYEVVITSYGQKNENNTTNKSREQKTSLHIYEFLLNNDELFVDEKLSLRVLSNVDIRQQVAEKLQMEYSNLSSSIVTNFKNSFKENSTWEVISNNIVTTLSESTVVTTANYEIDGFNFKPLVVTQEAPYTIKVSYKYTYKKGAPTCELENRDTIIAGEYTFNVEVYINSNEDLPIPVYEYGDLLAMKDGEYYRLVNDITVRGGEFEMITSTPAGLDGNGYAINIVGDTWGASVQNVTSFALFEQVATNAVFKNIKIVISGRKNIQIDNTYSASGVNIGVLTATNNGVITNCSVIGEDCLYVNMIATVNVMENSYFGTICAENNGYITNCQTSANISVSGASVGGFVANNNGQISSSFVKNARIANTSSRSNEEIVTGGFVCNNQGAISMSYIEGLQSSNKIYADYTANQYGLESKIIYTASSVGGFVYLNSGDIFDSYANIPIVSSSRCAGFVASNEGTIKRVFSLSKMKQRDTLNYGFVISYNQEEAVFEDCYFILEPSVINDYTSETNYVRGADGTYVGVIDGVTPLTIKGFNVTDASGTLNNNSPFANFLISNNANGTSGVWFYTFDKQLSAGLFSSLVTYETKVQEFASYDVNSKTYTTPSFVAGRLQLVSPNLIASSRFNLDSDSSSIQDGEFIYSIEDTNVLQGSRYNPYIIASAEDFEEYTRQRNSGILEYYRLVCDIDYIKEGIYSSGLSNRTLVAYFEGNNFKVANYSVNNKSGYISSGLFSQIGGVNSQESTLKNITFLPSYVNLPNSVFVGGVAGSLVNAKVYNVSLEGENVVIAGKNIVGGLFGRTYGETLLRDIYSNVVTKSSQYNSGLFIDKNNAEKLYNTIKYNETGANRTSVSYSGVAIGYVGGVGIVQNSYIGESAKSYGAIAGLMFGGIGALSSVSNIDLKLNSYNNEIKAYAFGGILAGESKGYVENITINSNILHKKLFSCYPILPISIGGISGVVAGGTINNVMSTEGYSVIGTDFTNLYGSLVDGYSSNTVNNPYVAKYVGGIAGYMVKGTISSVKICPDETKGGLIENGLIISGGNYVGGLVGYAEKLDLVKDIDIALTGHKKYINEDGNEIEEMVYTTYVSEASISQIKDMVFEKDNYFGLLVGYLNGEYSKKGILEVKTHKLYLYYADYSIAEEDFEKIVKLDVYYLGSEQGGIILSNGMIQKTFKNLTGTLEKILINN